MSRPAITLYLHVHQPYRLRQFSVFDISNKHDYFSGNGKQDNARIFHKIANKSYRPMNDLLEHLLQTHPGFKLSLSFSGLFLEQAEEFAPDVLADFQRLVATGRVEILASPYHHSLAFFYSRDEFERQIKLHTAKIEELFQVRPRVLANTELAYNDELAIWAQEHGYLGVLAEGWDTVLGWRSPNYVYRAAGTENVGLLLKNYRLSDDIAFRFSDRRWKDWPLTTEKYLSWLNDSYGQLINLFMDYETFGEHQWRDSGIFNFFAEFVQGWINEGGKFNTVSESLRKNQPTSELSMPRTVTWADSERDLSAWNGNDLQKQALKLLYDLEPRVLATDNAQLINDWRRLQASDQLYYMCTKWAADGDVHAYFSPYDSPYDAFLSYMNALRDIKWRIQNLPK